MHLLTTGPAESKVHFILAHGAGAPMTTPFMENIAALLAERDICTTRFEFAYMAARHEGLRKPPPKAERITSEYEAVIAKVKSTLAPSARLFIGGKSMGGRVASLIAGGLYDKRAISGLVCLGYPFHPPKKPETLRTAHLTELACPTLIVQGERDPFGTREEVDAFALSRAISLHWATDGDHDFAPRKASGVTRKATLQAAADAIAEFCRRNSKQDE